MAIVTVIGCCGGAVSSHAAEPFVGLPPAPGEVGNIRRGRDGRIEPVQPIDGGAERQRGGARQAPARARPQGNSGRGAANEPPAAAAPAAPEPAAPASPGPAPAQPQAADTEPLPGWLADERTGCRIWNAAPRASESVTWSGACRANNANGRGVAQWFENGRPTDRYEGDYRDGLEHGTGVYVRANGERYEGEWQDGERSGRGVYTWPNGDRYEGEWREGQRQGRGVYVWGSGVQYEGEWSAGEPSGQGAYSTPNQAPAPRSAPERGGVSRSD